MAAASTAVRRMVQHDAGLVVEHRFSRAAAVSGHRGDAGRGRLEEDDPEPLLLEPAPAGPAAQREHVGAGVQARQVR